VVMNTLWRLKFTVVMAAVAFLAILSGTQDARALALYSASASGTLTIVSATNFDTPGDFTDLTITGDAFVPIDDVFTDGSGIATTGGFADVLGDPLDIMIGDGLDQLSEVDGSASAVGYAESTHLTDGLLDLTNGSATDTFEIFFELAYSLSASASVGDPATEDAYAEATIDLLDDLGFVDVFETVLADALFGPPSDSLSDVVFFSIILAPGEIDSLALLSDADGFADAIPVPPTLALLAVGLVALGWRRRHA